MMSGSNICVGGVNGLTALRLDAPVQLAQMAESQEKNETVIKSVWIAERDETMVR